MVFTTIHSRMGGQQYAAFGAYDSGFESGSVRELLNVMEGKEENKEELGFAGQDPEDLIGVLNGLLVRCCMRRDFFSPAAATKRLMTKKAEYLYSQQEPSVTENKL